MSKRGLSPLLPVLLAGLLLAGPLGAQESASALGRRLDSLLALQAQLADRINSALQAPPSRMDTVRSGVLLAVVSGWRDQRATPLQLQEMQWGLDSAWTILESSLGRNADELGALRMEAVVADSTGTAFRLTSADTGSTVWNSTSWSTVQDRGLLPATIALELGRAYWKSGDTTLTRWLDPASFAIGFFRPLATDAERTHVELVTAPSQAVRACQAGDLLRCLDAVGVRPMQDPLRELYSPEERVALARELVPGTRNLNSGCLVQGRAAACDSLLRDHNLALPLSQDSRRLLVRFALADGGAGALRRLRETAGTLGERLGAAAGVPVNSLVAEWRARAVAARPDPVTAPGRTAVSTLCWAGLFGLLALRSTRWR